MRVNISKLLSLVDECVTVILKDCQPCQKLTLHLRAPIPSQSVQGYFSSVGHFEADEDGCVDLQKTASTGGNYEGVDPMGLFWSMSPDQRQAKGLRFLQRIVDKPQNYELRVLDGHRSQLEVEELLHEGNTSSLAQPALQFQRSYLHENVSRKPLGRSRGRVRGTLFSPKWEGQHPCVLDLFGLSGGVMEHRAALLASKGYQVLSLAYFGFEDLTPVIKELDMSYLEEATDFLLEQSPDNRIGVVGTSLGATSAVELTMLRPEVAAVAWINGMHGRILFPTKIGETVLPCYQPDSSPLEDSIDGNFSYLPLFSSQLEEKHLLQVERSKSYLLLINSGADMAVPNSTGEKLATRMREAGKGSRCELLQLAGAGHLLEPPYAPLNRIVLNNGQLIDYGGESAMQHNVAQLVAWRRIQTFLHSHLKN